MKQIRKINLAQLPTPLQTVSFNNTKFLLKRDDLTGCETSGNKIRKLEYLIADAKKNKSNLIITCGGEQSNHARATTIAAKSISARTKLFLWGKESSKQSGNLFLNKIYGNEIIYLDKRQYEKVNDLMQQENDKLLKKGIRPYVLPEGGSTSFGIKGYYDFILELKKQIQLKNIEGIVAASGTGGTAAGMLVAVSHFNLNLKVIAVNVLYSSKILKKKILTLAEALSLELNLKIKINEKNLIILDGFSKEGYKNISPNKITLIKKFASETGILFDPAYTGKAFYAYYHRFIKKGLGMKYIFVHTGGIFGVFGREKEYGL